MTARSLSRRQFMQQSIRGAGFYALGGAILANAWMSAQAGGDSVSNPFAYDIDRMASTDPKLLTHEQVGSFGCPGSDARRVATGLGDHLYIATKNGVNVVDAQGNKVAEIATTSPARCVAVAEDGTVYVGLRTHLEVFDTKGQSVATWEPPIRKTWFTGLSVGRNDVFAADSANRVILRYDRSGKLIGRIGEKNHERNIPGLIVPSPYLDVKLGPDDLLRVNNPGRHCVHLFTPDGDLELSWGKPSAAIEGFCGCCIPIGLALLPGGGCVTCEKGIPRVKVYSADRTLAGVVAGPEQFPENGRAGQNSDRADGTLGGLDAAVDAKGNIYILDLVADNVRVMKPKT